MIHFSMGLLCRQSTKGSVRYPSDIHIFITGKAEVNITMPLYLGKQTQTIASRRKTKANGKSTASHIRSLIMHFGSHPCSDCQCSEHMALKLRFLLICPTLIHLRFYFFQVVLKCWHYVQGHIQTLSAFFF